MDDLLIFGGVILFCGLVVAPIVAIVALRRSAAVRFELAALRRRVEELSDAAPNRRLRQRPPPSRRRRLRPLSRLTR